MDGWIDVSNIYECLCILVCSQGLLSLLCVRAGEEKARSERESFVRSNLSSDESNPLACQSAEECGPL